MSISVKHRDIIATKSTVGAFYTLSVYYLSNSCNIPDARCEDWLSMPSLV